MVKEIEEDSQFQPELANAGTKLVVVDFFATWCGPCTRIAPEVEALAATYSKAVFLKVDVDKCPDTASKYGVTAMPTFVFFRNKTKVDSLRGADKSALEQKIKQHYGEDDGDDEQTVEVKGHMDLSSLINKTGCECLNQSDEHTLEHALNPKGGYLESDCDEQLIIFISFNQAVKLHSMKMHGPADKGPKTVKIFINQPRTPDFDSAETMEPVEKFILTEEDLSNGGIIGLRFVKYQNVQSVTVFVHDNQEGGEVTQIDHLAFIGSPLSVTNMSDFKRVAGKKGESE